MAVNFPASPTNNQTFTSGGITWSYSTSIGAWRIVPNTIQGTSGLQGFQGIQGIQGTTGSQGIQGIQGTFGLQGFQGIQGTSIQGASGAGGGVTTFSAGITGFTPSTATAGAITLAGTLAVANGGTGATIASTARTNLGLVIGTNVQAWDTHLDQIAALSPTADNFIVGDGSSWTLETPSQARTSLGLVIGTNVQAYSARLADIAGLSPTSDNFIVGNGSSWTLETPAQSRTSLGLGTIATQASDSVSITGGTVTGTRITPRVSTTASSATPSINTDNVDVYGITALTVNITGFTMSGTPTNGQKLWIYIVGTAARSITWGGSFEASTIALPTTTVSTNRLDVGFVWNSVSSKWRCVGSA